MDSNSPLEGLPLGPGSAGPAVRDLQQRLGAVGHRTTPDEPATYGDATGEAVRAFQAARGLKQDGVCGAQTWHALVEAGYRLGDRHLYRRARMLRGDDVADLQRRLGALGFDAGRVDGIFGDQTERALGDFQRNAGLTVDRICGPATVRALVQLGSRGLEEPVAGVRERDALRRRPPTLDGRNVVIAESGGLGALTRALERALVANGAVVTVLQHPDGSEQAAAANAVGAEVLMALGLDPDSEGCAAAYYGAHGWESPGGRRLAELVQGLVPTAIGVKDGGVRAMSVPVLRESRMPAVLCELGPPPAVVERGAEIATALGEALTAWTVPPSE